MASVAEGSPQRKRLHSGSQRRQNKPLIEKRRRARINDCLTQLKVILMKDMSNESCRPNKLEKADILEMTVDYIRKMADTKNGPGISTPNDVIPSDVTPLRPFVDGYSRCLDEVQTFLENQRQLQPDVRHKLLSHCRELLLTRDVTSSRDNHPSRSDSVKTTSTVDDVKSPNVKRDFSEEASCESAFSDEEKEGGDVFMALMSDVSMTSADDVSMTSANDVSQGSLSTTALVAPFQRKASVLVSSASNLPGPSVSVSGSALSMNLSVSPSVSSASAVPLSSATSKTKSMTPMTHNVSETCDTYSRTQAVNDAFRVTDNLVYGMRIAGANPHIAGAGVTDNAGSGMRIAGALKLICGGNVFIVLDQPSQALPAGTISLDQNSPTLTSGQTTNILPNSVNSGQAAQTLAGSVSAGETGACTQQPVGTAVVNKQEPLNAHSFSSLTDVTKLHQMNRSTFDTPTSSDSKIFVSSPAAFMPTNFSPSVNTVRQLQYNTSLLVPANSVANIAPQVYCPSVFAYNSPASTSVPAQTLLYSSSMYGSNGLTYIPTPPHVTLSNLPGILSPTRMPLTSEASCHVISPVPVPLVVTPSNAEQPTSPRAVQSGVGNDVNNNDIHPFFSNSPVWRPW